MGFPLRDKEAAPPHTLLSVCGLHTAVQKPVTDGLRKGQDGSLGAYLYYPRADPWPEELGMTFVLYAITQLIYRGNPQSNHVVGGLVLVNENMVTEICAKKGLPVLPYWKNKLYHKRK